MPTLHLATRRSQLALAQARAYKRSLIACHERLGSPGLVVDELLVVTTGDKIQDRSLQEVGGKGLFIKEIEEALLEGKADFAVHSIKDVPAELADSLHLAAIPKREDPRDVLVSRDGQELSDLPQGARVGTSSLRRKTLLLKMRPDLVIGPLRGNVDTRLRKLDEGEADAIVLAYAGMRRLGIEERVTQVFSPEQMLPAVGQGALGLECRADDESTKALLLATQDADTHVAVTAERAFMKSVGGSCLLPVAAFGERQGDEIFLRAMLADADGSNPRFGELRAGYNVDDARRIGNELGASLR